MGSSRRKSRRTCCCCVEDVSASRVAAYSPLPPPPGYASSALPHVSHYRGWTGRIGHEITTHVQLSYRPGPPSDCTFCWEEWIDASPPGTEPIHLVNRQWNDVSTHPTMAHSFLQPRSVRCPQPA